MKAIKIFEAILLINFFTLGNLLAQSEKNMPKGTATQEAKMNKTDMNNTYMVIAPHSPEQCMKMMEDISKKGTAYLSKFKFGCLSGNHTAYAFLNASSEDAARKMLPEEIRANAKIEKVDALTAEQIKNLHKGK